MQYHFSNIAVKTSFFHLSAQASGSEMYLPEATFDLALYRLLYLLANNNKD